MDRDSFPVVTEGHLPSHIPRSWHCLVGRRGVHTIHALRSPGRAAHRLLAERELLGHVQSESCGRRRPGAHHVVRPLWTEEALVLHWALNQPLLALLQMEQRRQVLCSPVHWLAARLRQRDVHSARQEEHQDPAHHGLWVVAVEQLHLVLGGRAQERARPCRPHGDPDQNRD